MVQTVQASDLTLHEVKVKFGLHETKDENFFIEWWQDLPELTEAEKRSLDEIKANFLYLNAYPMSEEAVKLVVLSPLLAMAGFYRAPFHLKTEAVVQLALEDEGKIVRGRIDILVLQKQFWVLVVESKEAGFSLKNAIAQAIAYMAATPHPDQPAFSFMTNGTEFLFAKLVQPAKQYAFSDLSSL
ncbi:type I restriction enzyme HsdR N-terminal domain-containing protein [Kovacikia minuta CCNUW1]|uniref:type I restriction endonuclease n=1 Tax=Kovacikia minuta TaxID=2931930 RepID=UPI001CC8F153|nr:type I restriction endonuclease [Kovacikia minuta]UBF28128.1 type I restriction enzyme HsdR N-terminal domain-containing protein [Kovacikia minuta CCNUW1]